METVLIGKEILAETFHSLAIQEPCYDFYGFHTGLPPILIYCKKIPPFVVLYHIKVLLLQPLDDSKPPLLLEID